jgi:parallel beta-helix repeat protein
VNISGFTIQNSGTDWWNVGIFIRENYGTISDTIVTNNYYGIRIYGYSVWEPSYCNTIENNIISSNIGYGVSLWYGEDNILEGNAIHSNSIGISLHLSDFNIIVNNSITSNNAFGIHLGGYCDYDTIIGNNISNNRDGIEISYSKDNTITANTISYNYNDGISLKGSVRTIVANNLISDNVNGIYLTVGSSGSNSYNSKDNVIMKNTFRGNSRTAFFVHKLPIEDGGYNNTWQQNYWNEPRIAPKLIFGFIFPFPWLNIDWRPAQEPYDI